MYTAQRSDRGVRRTTGAWSAGVSDTDHRDYHIASEEAFIEMLRLERKRTERSRKQFVLMLLHVEPLLVHTGQREEHVRKILSALFSSVRETDARGWYRNDGIIGVIFTEICEKDLSSALDAVFGKVATSLRGNLGSESTEIRISFHLFPEDGNKQSLERPSDSVFYRDLSQRHDSTGLARSLKRAMDIAGSLLALILLSPLLILITLAIKLSSKGPVLFRQIRLGRRGARFTFLKFRSMYFKNDPKLHQEYIAQFISGTLGIEQSSQHQKKVFKLREDPRVTPVGRFLRRTSLDELPQFLNVLKGEMSLVGPRPPIPYEVERYDIWHRRRLLEAKPGITGLWQVSGRSRTTFDEMVRLDLKYAKAWSLWLDIDILLRTPRAVLSGEGAY